MPADKASPLNSKIKFVLPTLGSDTAVDETASPLNTSQTGEGAGGKTGDPRKSKINVFQQKKVEKKKDASTQLSETKPVDNTTGDPQRSQSVNGTTNENKSYTTGTGGKIDVAYDEPMQARNENLQKLIDEKKNAPNITKDIKTAQLEVPQIQTAQDNTSVDLGGPKGIVYVQTPEGTTIPVQTHLPGKDLAENVGDVATTFGNSFNTWVNDVYQNVVNPNKQGIPLNPLFDVPFSEQLTKFIPGYENPRYKSTENLPSYIKDFKLKTDYQYGDTPPEAPTEFIGHLTGSLAPLMLAEMTGLPPTISFPLIQEPGLQQRIKNGEISEGDANWERGASTLMGGIFEMPVTRTLFKEIKDLPVKESTKMGITKAGDVLFKTIGTGMVDAMKQIAQGKKPDMNEIAINAGTIFVMELMGGHQKIKKMSEKFGDERLLNFVSRFAKGEKLDPEIQSDVEAIHNKPITDVRRLLLGPREHRFEVGQDGTITEVKRNAPQDMLLSTMEKVYGMKPEEIAQAKENVSQIPNTKEQLPITDKNRMLPPNREANFTIDEKGQVKPIDKPQQQDLLLTSKERQLGMKPEEILKSKENIKQVPDMKDVTKPELGNEKNKQAWEMTKAEFDKTKKGSDDYGEMHRQEIIGALNEGKNVPEEVLKDYPDLKKTPSSSPSQGEGTLMPGDKVKSRNYRNPEEVLTVVDTRKDNMLKVRDAKGVESLVSKGSISKVEGFNKIASLRSQMESKASEVRKSRGKRRAEQEAEMLKLYEEYKQQYKDETGTEFTPDKKTETGKVLDYIEAKKKIAGNKGKFGLQSSLLPGGFNPENLPEYVKIGKYHLDNLKRSAKDKAVTFGDWAIEMVREFSDYIRPHLRTVWQEMQKVKETPDVTKQELGNEKGFDSAQPDKNKIRPERVNQQSDFGFGDNGKVKGEKTKDAYSAFDNADGSTEPVKGKGWQADKLVDEYRALKQRRNRFEKGSEKYDEISGNMERLKKKITDLQDITARNKSMDKEQNTRGKRDLYDEIIRKLPDYESKANEQGYTGEDAYEQVRKLIRRDLLTDEAFQVMSLREKQFLQKSLDEQFEALNKRRLQLGTEFYEPYTEHGLKQFLKGSLKQSLNLVAKMGEAGKEISDRIKKFNDRRRELMGKPSVVVLDAGKLTKEEYQNLTAIRKAMMMETGLVPEPINENVRRINKKINEYYDETANLLRQRGFETTNMSTGEVYGFTPRKEYDPRVLEITLDKLGVARDKNGEPVFSAARKRQTAFMVESGQARNLQEASEMLDEYIRKKTTVTKAGNVEFARVKDIEFAPEMYIQDPIKRLITYGVKVSERIAHSEQFGMDGNIASRLLSRIEAEGYNREFASELYRYEKGGGLTEKELKTLKWVNWLKGANTMTKFSFFTTLRNAPQGLLNSAVRGNLSSAIRGFIGAYRYANKENAYMSGALADSIESIVMKEIGGNLADINKMSKSYEYLKKIGWKEGDNLAGFFLKNIGFTANERFNRVISSTAGELFYRDMLSRIKNDSILKKRAYREFDKMGLDAKKITERGDFTPEELNTIRRTFAGETQFNVRPGDLPLFWSSPWGKLITQWKSWGYKQTQFIHDNVIKEMGKGNPFPAITMMTTFGVTGEAINMIIDGIRGMFGFNPKKKDNGEDESVIDKSAIGKLQQGKMGDFAWRVFEDMAGLGAFSLIYDVYRSVGYGKSPTGDISQGLSSVLLGPTFSSGGRLISDILFPLFNVDKADEEKTWITMAKNIYRNVMTNVLPYGGIIRSFGVTKTVEDWLFGKKVSDRQKKYDRLKEQGVNIKVLDEIDNQEREVKKLHDKALETRSKEDIDAYWKADGELDKRKESSDEYRKLMELQTEDQMQRQEVLGSGKYKIWNELKDKGIDITKLKDIDAKEREVNRLKDKAEQTKNQEDVKIWKTAKYELDKMKNKSSEYYEYRKLEKKYGDEKKKEKQQIFK